MKFTITLIDRTTSCTIKVTACKTQYELRSTLGTWVDYHKADLENRKVAIHCAITGDE